MSQVVTRGTVRIDVESCKGCELCIPACRPGVLSMTTDRFNQRGYQYPELSAGCTACRACVDVCPDFVFQLWKFDSPRELPEGPVAASAVHREVEIQREQRI
jgi:2-oxoglutarate ferredoxin oxidoreductase subunit delta